MRSRPNPASATPVAHSEAALPLPGQQVVSAQWSAESPAPHAATVLEQLCSVCSDHDLSQLSTRLEGLAVLVGRDLVAVQGQLMGPVHCHGPVKESAEHLVRLGGKRLRPLCLALAARVGTPSDDNIRDLAVAVELVHSATLLHDDVVDQGDTRRGAPTARLIYGNAASIFAGDLLLIEAIRRVVGTGIPDLLPSMLDAIDEMIGAESLQLSCRDLLVADLQTYEAVVVGKTGALFSWALHAGGRAGGSDAVVCAALEKFGREMGVTFQLVDDLLDLCGDSEETGKGLFADLREGKATYPLILAMERDPELRPHVGAMLERPLTEGLEAAEIHRVVTAMASTGALESTRAVAAQRSEAALAALSGVPDGPARRGLAGLCELLLRRIR
jgi:octaprenyl-diphosphate synthase